MGFTAGAAEWGHIQQPWLEDFDALRAYITQYCSAYPNGDVNIAVDNWVLEAKRS